MPDAPFITTKVKKSSGRIQQYGLMWQATKDPISMELDMIRHGGQWEKQSGGLAGNGLYFHFRRFQELVWPERIWEKGPFKNHWADECLESYISYQYIGVMGCAASGKSDSFGCNSLTEWYAWPDCTTVLVSSTDLKSLELRIWGMIKKYHKLASRMRDWIPGHLIEGKQMIIQDEQEQFKEGRDFKNGIIAVPCRKGTQFVGLGCFPSGTLVDTKFGPRPIESLGAGDEVWSANGLNRIRRCSTRIAESLVRIHLSDGRMIDCTPNHPFLTSSGWEHCIDIRPNDYVLSGHETMQLLRQGSIREGAIEVLLHGMQAGALEENLPCLQERILPFGFQEHLLWKILHDEIENVGQGLCREDKGEGEYGRSREEDASVAKGSSRSFQETCESQQTSGWGYPIRHYQTDLDYSAQEWRKGLQRARDGMSTNTSGINLVGFVPGVEMEHAHPGEITAHWKRRMALHEGRPWMGWFEAGRGGGRGMSLKADSKPSGCSTRCQTQGAWVDRVEILERSGDERYNNGEGGYRVHNLEVEGHPSYCVAGLVSHNSYVGIHNKRVRLIADECNLMPRAFLDSTSNLSKCEDFKLVGLGNPNETTNAHGVLCEPAPNLGGWESGIDQTPGTKIWSTKFPDGICLQLPGSDTPNKDAEDGEEPFPFLITPKQLREDAQIWSVDDWHYKMMDEAMMPRGQGARRVLTRQACVKFGAFSGPKWRDSRRTSIAFLDAAYRGVGGDRCVFGELQFGPEAETKPAALSPDAFVVQDNRGERQRQIIALVDLVVVPIQAEKGSDQPEDQIVRFVMSQCESRGISPDNFFYDAGMRTSLVTAFSRIWKHVGNSIDCGGKPTEQIVSMEIQKKACDYYSKFITELWFNVRLIVESSQFRGMTEEACTEFSQREWKMSQGNKIEVESKEEMKGKTGRSPDLADAIAVGVHGARQRGFTIMRAKPDKDPVRGPDWRDDLKKRARALWNSGNLNYQA